MTDMDEKPEIDFPGGEPPTELVITDVVVGTGAEARPGGQVLVHYVGMTAPEAARVLGVPPGTVYSRLHYATRQMRGVLASDAPSALTAAER